MGVAARVHLGVAGRGRPLSESTPNVDDLYRRLREADCFEDFVSLVGEAKAAWDAHPEEQEKVDEWRGDAFREMARAAGADPEKGRQGLLLLVEWVRRLPYDQPSMHVYSASETMRRWLGKCAPDDRIGLRDALIDGALPLLRESDPRPACQVFRLVGRRRKDLVEALFARAGELATAANPAEADVLRCLAFLGLASDRHDRLLARLNELIQAEPSFSAVSALRRLADPRSLRYLDKALGLDSEAADPNLPQFAERLPAEVAAWHWDAHVQDSAWRAYVSASWFLTTAGRRSLLIAGDILQRVDHSEVVPELLRWIAECDAEGGIGAGWVATLLGRLTELAGPEHISGWLRGAPDRALSVLRDKAGSTAAGLAVKERALETRYNAWRVLGGVGDEGFLGDMPTLAETALRGETEAFAAGKLCRLLACMRMDPLPEVVREWITTEQRVGIGEEGWDERIAAVELAGSAGTMEALRALLRFHVVNEDDEVDVTIPRAIAACVLACHREGHSNALDRLLRVLLDKKQLLFRRWTMGYALELLAGGLGRELLDHPDCGRLYALVEDDAEPENVRVDVAVALARAIREGSVAGRQAAGPPDVLVHQLRQWASDENRRWTAWLAMEALARIDRLDRVPGLEAELVEIATGQPVDWTTNEAGSAAAILAWQYCNSPETHAGTMARLLREVNQYSIALARSGVASAHLPAPTGQAAPVPAPVAEALLDRARSQQTVFTSERETLQLAAELLPQEFVGIEWRTECKHWRPEARKALADLLPPIARHAEATVTSLLEFLARDPSQAVRRAALRAMSRLDDDSLLLARCESLAGNDDCDERRLATESLVWLPDDAEAKELRDKLHRDSEPEVREATAEAWAARRQRLWAAHHMAEMDLVVRQARDHVGSVLASNRHASAVWRRSTALAQVGDDETLQRVRELRRPDLPPHLDHLLSRLEADVERRCQKMVHGWREEWTPAATDIRRVTASVSAGDGGPEEVECWLWFRSDPQLHGTRRWGGGFRPAKAWLGQTGTARLVIDGKPHGITVFHCAVGVGRESAGNEVLFHGHGHAPHVPDGPG